MENNMHLPKFVTRDDLEKIKNLEAVEKQLHNQIISNRYQRVQLDKSDKALNEQIADVAVERKSMNELVQAKYGNIARIDENGQYVTFEDIQMMQSSQNLQPKNDEDNVINDPEPTKSK
jgi:phage repressor protein C with HTH and peptisase S24 domain